MMLMISSEPPDRPPLDHDIVVDNFSRIYIVIGNTHPLNGVYAYLKYVPTDTPTQWKWRGRYLMRVLKDYSVLNMVKASSLRKDLMRFDPVLGSEAPIVEWSDISVWLKPEERMNELFRRVNDELEAKVLEAVEALTIHTGIPPTSLGVGGSILLKSHHPKASDINIIVYGCKESSSVAMSSELGLDKPSDEAIMRRLMKKSVLHRLPLPMVRKVIPPYKLVAVKGTPVGITFVGRYIKRWGDEVFRPLGPAECLLSVEGGDCRSLFYPSRTKVSETLKVISGPKLLMKSPPTQIISYEGLYNYVLFRGGCVRVRGVAELVEPSGNLVILVGGREEPGYVLPCG